jgi:hypothetical protein
MQSLNATEIEGEETQKTFIRGCRVWVCFCVGMCLRHKHHAASYHRIISHSITSYIMSHQQQDCGEGKLLLSKYAMNGTMLWSTKCTFGNYNLHAKKIFVDNNIIQQLCYRRALSLRSMKIKEGVFSVEGSKMVCTQISCIIKKYITLIYT